MTLPVARMINTAIHVIQDEGPMGLVRAVVRNLYRFFPFLQTTSPGSHGTNPPEEIDVVYRVLRADDRRGTMIDVGAHYGGSLAPFARSGWRVFAFEPDSLNRQQLIDRGFDTMPNVTIDPRGVADKRSANAPFYRSKESTGISGLSAFHRSHVQAETVEVTTLELFVEEQGVKAIDFLKIDTEGFDLPVLKGVPWSKTQPEIILCEFEDKKTLPLGYGFHDMAGYLEDLGYKLVISEWYPIERYGVKHEWRRFAQYPCELADPDAWGNIFAVKEHHFSALVDACHLE